MDFYLVEKSYFGLGKNNKNKIVFKLYTVRKSKNKCTSRTEMRRCRERIAKINLDKLKWKELGL
jgi:hypothetical protein